MPNGCNLLPGAEFYVAVDNKGLWPNLTLLPNGDIVAAVYNHPSHGLGAGDVELWASADEGRMWTLRSVVSDHSDQPTFIRMNHAVGLNAQRELVALVSGYHEGQRRPTLPVQVCVSADGGCTWQRHLLEDNFVPYGDIVCMPDGALVCATYRTVCLDPRRYECPLLVSTDHARSWSHYADLGDVNETSLLRCRDGLWLASSRTPVKDRMDGALPHGSGQALRRSTDEGKTWGAPKPVSPQGQENAHLLELSDGRILHSFTSRIPGLFGVVFRLSEDRGETWGEPQVLISMPGSDWHKTDCGYPSSVELADGTIVTAYYFGAKKPEWFEHGLPWHPRYHMGVARWRA